MPARVREHATYEDLVRLPEDVVGELIDGELYASPRPAGPHIVAKSTVGFALGPPFHFGVEGPGGWWILDEPELHFGQNVLVPDLAGWRRERMPDPPREHIVSIVPDWICEVTSPSIEAFQRQDDQWRLNIYGDDAIVRIAPFEAIEINLTLFWGPLPT
ncbi:MAG TPA: Uma2 family endonuclease [Thermoanaerobaculia bacterium]|nr:Uma2 family endonuclease [Thermoanaerobaculia bacterium]